MGKAETKYVIHNKVGDLYWLGASQRCWVPEAFGASKFKSADNATHEVNNIPNCDTRDIEVIQYAGKSSSMNAIDLTATKVLTPEEADATFDILQTCVSAFKDLDAMIVYYSQEEKKYDGMQQDILHRIEFGSVVGLTGLRLIAKLKDVRLKRREIKDKVAYLLAVKSSTVPLLGSTMETFEKHTDSRVYTPRVLNELFPEVENKEG